MRALVERWVALDRLPRKPLAGVTGLGPLIDGLEALVRDNPLDARVATCVHAIRVSHGAVPLRALLEKVDLTARSLQRLFADQVGIGPKLLARIVRFQRIFAALRAEPASLARVALFTA